VSSRSARRSPQSAPPARRAPASAPRFPRVPLKEPRRLTGKERRWLDANRGPLKVFERALDRFASRYVYPRLFRTWSPYSWQLPRGLEISEGTLRPVPWPGELPPLDVLLLTDIHAGPFLRPALLADLVHDLMKLEPHLVAIGGDIVSGEEDDLDPFLEALAPLARAPLGAWFAMGNHEYFTSNPDGVVDRLDSIGIVTLRNETVEIGHGPGSFRLGGLDDLVLGSPDWRALCAKGPPHLLLAHNPDVFYDAVGRGIGLVLSGHTHAGQIRVPGRRPIVRQSRYCLDEGHMTFGEGHLLVSRGLGASNFPWRVGARPEVVRLTLAPR
jgi:uncharacterized protein